MPKWFGIVSWEITLKAASASKRQRTTKALGSGSDLASFHLRLRWILFIAVESFLRGDKLAPSSQPSQPLRTEERSGPFCSDGQIEFLEWTSVTGNRPSTL